MFFPIKRTRCYVVLGYFRIFYTAGNVIQSPRQGLLNFIFDYFPVCSESYLAISFVSFAVGTYWHNREYNGLGRVLKIVSSNDCRDDCC